MYKHVLWCNIFDKGNDFVLGLVSFLSKPLEKKWVVKGFRAWVLSEPSCAHPERERARERENNIHMRLILPVFEMGPCPWAILFPQMPLH